MDVFLFNLLLPLPMWPVVTGVSKVDNNRFWGLADFAEKATTADVVLSVLDET